MQKHPTIKRLLIIPALLGAFAAGYLFRDPLTAYNQVYENGRASMAHEIAGCTIQEAHQELCLIPCSTDSDCLAKNGQADH